MCVIYAGEYVHHVENNIGAIAKKRGEKLELDPDDIILKYQRELIETDDIDFYISRAKRLALEYKNNRTRIGSNYASSRTMRSPFLMLSLRKSIMSVDMFGGIHRRQVESPPPPET